MANIPIVVTVTGPGGVASASAVIIVTDPVQQPISLFTAQTPTQSGLDDGVNYELGLKFQSTVVGSITKIRFWKSSGETGAHTGKIYSLNGAVLASVNFSGETASGWQVQTLATPLSISANTTYVVTVNTGSRLYVATNNGLAAQISNGVLRSVTGSNGVFGPVGALPTNSYQSSNYFRDVVFVPSGAPLPADTQAPSIPTGLSAAVVSSSRIDLVWSASSDNVGVAGYRVLRNGVEIGAPSTNSFINTGLTASTTYTYTVRAFDAAGNISEQSSSISATTQSGGVVIATKPDATNRPHMISSNVLAFIDGAGVAQQVTLKPLPAQGSTFGVDASGNPNNGARVGSGGSVTITNANTIIDGYNLTNGVVIEANNTTVRRCRISDGGYWGVKINYDNDYEGTLIEDCEILNSGSYGIYGHDFTARRLSIHDAGEDGINASGSNGTVLDCYIYDLGAAPGSHGDGVQISGGSGWVIRGNNFYMPEHTGHLSNAAIFLGTDFGGINNITIDSNWMNGGNYTIFSVDKSEGYGAPTNIVITNNFFGRDYNYGVADIDGNSYTWVNNRWEDTGALIPNP